MKTDPIVLLSLGKQASEVVKATIYFREISTDTIMNVIRRGEIYTSAGGFRIEDEDLNPLVKHIDGTVDSVLGMPLDASVRIIQAVTLDC